MKILIVEDEPLIAAELEHRLRRLGYETAPSLRSGEQAVAFFESNAAPDLAIFDIHLEGPMDGIEAAVEVLKKQPRLPLIFLTSNTDDGTFARAKVARPAAFLSKPFRERDLLSAIELAVCQPDDDKTTPAPQPESSGFLLDDRLFVKTKERMVRIFFSEILWAEADGYYCKIATAEREYLLSQTLGKVGEVLEKLPGFVRVHRSYIVNLRHVEQLGDLHLYLGKKQIPVGRNTWENVLGFFQKL